MSQFGYLCIICYAFYAIETWPEKLNLRVLIFNIELNALVFGEKKNHKITVDFYIQLMRNFILFCIGRRHDVFLICL